MKLIVFDLSDPFREDVGLSLLVGISKTEQIPVHRFPVIDIGRVTDLAALEEEIPRIFTSEGRVLTNLFPHVTVGMGQHLIAFVVSELLRLRRLA